MFTQKSVVENYFYDLTSADFQTSRQKNNVFQKLKVPRRSPKLKIIEILMIRIDFKSQF